MEFKVLGKEVWREGEGIGLDLDRNKLIAFVSTAVNLRVQSKVSS